MGSFSNVAYNMSVEDKVLDYVIWMGNDYKALLKSYINQTGKIPMIPKWALGLWMSKCSYQTQDEIYEVVKISKERDIKIDVIHIDGWQKEGDAGAWVWDYERFPNPEEMIYKLKKEGIHLCLWIFPYIDENSKYFKEAEEKGFLVKNTKGVTSRFYSTATSTSKVGCFDFTNPHFIEWYKPKVRSVVSMGIGAVKTDFSEAVPEDAVYFDGSTGIQGHNKLTFLYAKTIYDIMAEVKIPLGELPMLWGRSGYAGSHTIPAAWAGDSSTHLNNHACILRGGLSASMSGIPFWGFDMGGFYNTDHEGYECVPTDEEYIRSCQFGFFNSLSRCHGKTPREPWNFGEKAEKIFKKFNDIRHLLLPYLYSTTYKTHLSDIPVIRPVVALEFNQGNQPTISVCHVKKQSENIISFLEAHQYACEGLLPLDGDVIIFVGIMDSDFRTESIEAFYVPKGTFVKLNPLIVHGTQYPVDKEDVHIVCMLPGRTFKNDMLSRRLETGEQIRITRGYKK